MTPSSDKKNKSGHLHYKRLGRELAMQYLYQADMLGGERDEGTLNLFWLQAESSGVFPVNRQFKKGREFAEKLIFGVLENLDRIDSTIAGHSEKWDISRMAAVDRNVMRVAVYEMLFCADIPPVVSINEAVGIAKDFSSEKSGMFINGILNGIMDKLDRPARKAVDRL